MQNKKGRTTRNELLKRQIERFLMKKNFNPLYVGFSYTVTILNELLTKKYQRFNLSSEIFPKVAKKYSANKHNIQRCLTFFFNANKKFYLPDYCSKNTTKGIIDYLYREAQQDVFIKNFLV
jgi:hypothetical protein